MTDKDSNSKLKLITLKPVRKIRHTNPVVQEYIRQLKKEIKLKVVSK